MVNAITFRERLNSYLTVRTGQNSIVLLVLFLFFVFNVLSVQGRTSTYDEHKHYRYGVNILNGDSTRFDDSKMPFSAWNALPAKIAEAVPFLDRLYLSRFITARLMTTLFSLLVAYVVFYWSRELYGFVPALISLGLYVLDPNIIAHSQLVTTDMYAAGMVLFSSYWLWKFANTRKWSHGLFLAFTLGMAQLAKYTAISLYPLFAIALLVYDWRFPAEADKGSNGRALRSILLQYANYILVAAIAAIFIINAGFLFNRTFTPLRDYSLRSDLFKSIQSKISFVVPVPYPYLEGLDWIIQREGSNEGFGHIYLLGETRYNKGFPGYYFVAFLLKVPIATQIILLSALVVYLVDRSRRIHFIRNELFLLWPIFFYTIYFNFFYRAQIGIRFFLIVFPLLYIFGGGLFTNWKTFDVRKKWLGFALGAYLIVSVLSYYPFYLSYFNEIVWDRKMAYQYLADSNLDWGQDDAIVNAYLAEHPEVRKPWRRPRLLPATTRYYIQVNQLVGVTADPRAYQWLRENFEPIDRIAPSCLLFEITPEQMRELCESTTYCDRKQQ
jgi:4-amino-4-deoxy-L-arabinose transferase-like glycosyltransferase